MKFGFREPSLTKRLAARTSIKRQLVHRMGLKMPRGFGWVRDPNKALYNRVYGRTTVDPIKLIGRSSSIVGVVFGVLVAIVAGIFSGLSGRRRR